jgi:hypothetical protein
MLTTTQNKINLPACMRVFLMCKMLYPLWRVSKIFPILKMQNLQRIGGTGGKAKPFAADRADERRLGDAGKTSVIIA